MAQVPNKQPARLEPGVMAGSLIDRDKRLRFSFDGRPYEGYAGDNLAAALLANGLRVIGRSFKYHRPRGILGSGAEEPNALVTLEEPGGMRPNLRATQVPLYEGLVARSQNCWPGPGFDLAAVLGLAAPVIPAGFYYKTFLGPKGAWPFYEKVIRRLAGLGPAPVTADNETYGQRYAHCELLIIGGGVAGLAAAQAAIASGQRVILVEERVYLGGSLRCEEAVIDGTPADDWLDRVERELGAAEKVTVLKNCSAFAYQDQDLVLALEDCRAKDATAPWCQRLWKIRAKQVLLASGAQERPLVFPDNDRPGIMMASAARHYLAGHGVLPGRRIAIFTNNDSAYGLLPLLRAAGCEIAGLVDLRANPGAAVADELEKVGCRHFLRSAVIGTRGRKGLQEMEVAHLDDSGKPRGPGEKLSGDLLLVSGGWQPNLQLFAQSGGSHRFSPDHGCFLPDETHQALRCAGAVRGAFGLADALASARSALTESLAALGSSGDLRPFPTVTQEPPGPGEIGEAIGPSGLHRKAFVDFQNDVTAADLALAAREGYDDIELAKRYTTFGMGTDQGRSSAVNGALLLAELTEKPVPDVGLFTIRPPVSPVPLAAIAGERQGEALAPIRRTPFHEANAAAGCRFESSGSWHYPRIFPRGAETMAETIEREVRAVREGVGCVDMSSLGKIDLQGRDVLAFLERIYCNDMASLRVGRCRYGLMLREDGILFDDGTLARLDEKHFLLTCTTANAGAVWQQLERLRQVEWPDLDVRMTSVTDHWASLAIAGPQSRELLGRLDPDFAIDGESLPFLGHSSGRLAGLPARVFRISYSGELSYEVNVPAGLASRLWQALNLAGSDFDLTPYGLEALDVLRIEKGHVATGTEIDGRTTPGDLGLGRMVSRKKDFLGRALLHRPALQADDRLQFIGLRAADRKTPIPPGAQITGQEDKQISQGRVTAAIHSPSLEEPIALALVAGGHGRLGEEVLARSPLRGQEVPCEITSPHFYDPEGVRLRA
jgi:sarcosine oxidase subunit alpha